MDGVSEWRKLKNNRLQELKETKERENSDGKAL